MKSNFKTMLFLFIGVVISILTITYKGSAASLDYNNSHTIFSSQYSNIIKCTNEFIKTQQKNSRGCPWNYNTKFGKVVTTYDLDGNVNGFIINLKTNNKESGYIIIDNNVTSPFISEFGYEGKYYLQQNPKFEKLKNKKIISLGNFNYLYFDNRTIKDAYTNNNISKNNIPKLKKKYNNYKNSKDIIFNENQKTSSDLNQSKSSNILKKNALEMKSSASYSMPELWRPKTFIPYTMNQFKYETGVVNDCGWCQPTATVNFLYFWQTRKGISGLLKNNNAYVTFDTIESYVGYPYNTTTKQGYNGLIRYCNDVGRAPSGSGISYNVSWNWLKTNITNGNMPIIDIATSSLDPSLTGYHAIIGVGWEQNSNGNYVRIINQWDQSLSHFYNFNNGNYITASYYARW